MFLVYVLFGYPLVLKVLSREHYRPIERGPVRRPVSVLIAVHNGEAFLEQKLQSLLSLSYPRELMEIFVLSDGSTDRTEQIARDMAPLGIRLLALPRAGKASALSAGIQQACGDFLVFTDVRQTFKPDSLDRLLAPMADPSVGVVSGELVIVDPKSSEEANTGLYWRYEYWIREQLSRIDSIFGATGAFYAVRRELAVPIPRGTLLDDMYLPLAAFFRGYRLVVESGAHVYDIPTSLNSEFRRKVRTLAGNYQILMAYPQLLGPRNRMWFHFLSYKFARLLMPFALIVMFLATFGFPESWRTNLLGLQLGFYTLGIGDRWIPERFPLKRMSSLIGTFVTLMAATFWATSILFVPSDRVWKTRNDPRLIE